MTEQAKLFNRNFVLLWQGQLVSQLGSQAFAIAMMFWVKHETGSASLMGLVMMVSMLPSVVLGPIAGTVADSYSRRNIIILSDIVRGVIVLSLAAFLYFSPVIVAGIIVWLFVVNLMLGVISAFFNPAITAAIPDIVPADKISGANSLNQSSQQVSMFVGQALGGYLFVLLGAPLLFLVDGLTYLFSAASETLITIPQTVPERAPSWRARIRQFKADTCAGLQYAWGHAGLRALFFSATFINFFAVPLLILLPFYVEDVLHVSPAWYGYILASFGFGALLGYGLAGTLRFRDETRSKVVLGSLILMAGCLPVFSVVRNANVALLLMTLVGILNGFFNINVITTLQTATPANVRGRMFGLLMTLTSGLTPIAMGLAGVAADLLDQNIPLIYAVCGFATVALSLLTTVNPSLRSFLRGASADV